MRFASTKTARHKLARFLKEHVPEEEPQEAAPAPGTEASGEAFSACTAEACDIFSDVPPHLVELTLGCNGRPGLADDIVAVIRSHSHQIEVRVPSLHARILGALSIPLELPPLAMTARLHSACVPS